MKVYVLYEKYYDYGGTETGIIGIYSTRELAYEARELLRLIEVGASCFNHYCVGYDDT